MLRTRTTVGNAWIADMLAMGHPDRLAGPSRTADKAVSQWIKDFETVLVRGVR